MVYILFLIGFVFLVKGADFLVDGSSSLAKKMHIPDIVIGLTIVALGTSMPELIVNIFSSLSGNSGIAIGNILGSNISNILLILGISSLFCPLIVKKNTLNKEIPFSILATVALLFLASDSIFTKGAESMLSISDGLVLILFFAIFMYYTVSIAKANKDEGDDESVKTYPVWKSLIMVAGGIIGLALGGRWIVNGAVSIAQMFHMSETLIGLTIVAIGTSLPELATSVAAARKKKSDIAIGNVVGSNIFNILFVLGISSSIKALPFETGNILDIAMVLLCSVLLMIFVLIGKKKKEYRLERWGGIIFILLYIAYVTFLVIQNMAK